MVFTNLLLDDSTPELRKFPFGVLAAQPKEVGEDLIPKILAVKGNGQSVEFLTTDKVRTYVRACVRACVRKDGRKEGRRDSVRWLATL